MTKSSNAAGTGALGLNLLSTWLVFLRNGGEGRRRTLHSRSLHIMVHTPNTAISSPPPAPWSTVCEQWEGEPWLRTPWRPIQYQDTPGIMAAPATNVRAQLHRGSPTSSKGVLPFWSMRWLRPWSHTASMLQQGQTLQRGNALHSADRHGAEASPKNASVMASCPTKSNG